MALASTDARITVAGPDGSREIPFGDFYVPVGDTPHHETALHHGEIITSIVVPQLPAPARSTYRKVRERASYAFAVGSIAAVVTTEGDRLQDARISLGAVASRPWRAHAAEEVLRGQTVSCALFAAAADAALAGAEPLRDNAYKVPLLRNLIVAVLAHLTGTTDHEEGL